jgi:hypothetical protein
MGPAWVKARAMGQSFHPLPIRFGCSGTRGTQGPLWPKAKRWLCLARMESAGECAEALSHRPSLRTRRLWRIRFEPDKAGLDFAKPQRRLSLDKRFALERTDFVPKLHFPTQRLTSVGEEGKWRS